MTDPAAVAAAPQAPTSRGGAGDVRDHVLEQPAPWVAGCSDRGLRHARNEDAVATAAGPGRAAVLVVCDGVSSSQDSEVASLAAARAAREVLTAAVGSPDPGSGSRVAVLDGALRAAVAAAGRAVTAATPSGTAHPGACTLAAAVTEDDLVAFATVGDSRVYWLPDVSTTDAARQLSLDDSVAQLRMEMGVPRADAESSPQAHAITRWLGRDSADPEPATGALSVVAPGWVLVCSDGLWNYCSEPADLQRLVADLGHDRPGDLCEALVRWALDQGGRDNVSVAVSRHSPASTDTAGGLR